MTGHCRICGVDLDEQDNELARLVAWPPCLLPGDLPADDELCRQCQVKVNNCLCGRPRAADNTLYCDDCLEASEYEDSEP